MAEVVPTFDLIKDGSGSVNSELWVDLGVIPVGKMLWFGFATFISEDKSLTYEVRSNKSTKSGGTVADTIPHDFSSAVGGASVDRDFCRGGLTVTQSVISTGVEHWWLRVRSASANAGLFGYIFYYSEY